MRSYAAVLLDRIVDLRDAVRERIPIGAAKMTAKAQQANPSGPNKRYKPTSQPIRWLRELFAITGWILAFIQLFVFDISGYLISHLPVPEWVSKYRSLIFLGILIILWLVLGNHRFLRFIGYVIAYPFIVILWKVPKMLFKNWPIFVAFSPAIHSIFTSFRSTFIIYGSGFISAFVTVFAPQTWAIGAGMTLLAIALLYHFFGQLKTAFSSRTVFSSTADVVSEIWEATKGSNVFVPPTDIDPSTSEGKEKFGASLFTSYAITASLGMFARKMREIADDRKLDFYLILSWLVTVAITIIVFGLLYNGLSRIDPASFTSEASIWGFLGYSMCVLTTSELSAISPLSSFAKTLSYFELFGTLSILILMVFLVLTSLRDKYRSDLSRISSELMQTADKFESLFTENYDLTMHAAEKFLLDYNLFLAKLVLRFRYRKEVIEQFEIEFKNSNNITSSAEAIDIKGEA